jgi:tricarballylate dehydrogenase
MAFQSTYDVIVLGAGNAALVAALAAHERGARVLVLEKAPYEYRGGNSRLTAGVFRFGYVSLAALRELVPALTDAAWEASDLCPYTPENFYTDLMRLSEGLADAELTQLLVTQAYDTAVWMRDRGVRWELATVPPGVQSARAQASFVRTPGEGPGLMEMLFRSVEQRGIEVGYQTAGQRLYVNDQGRVEGIQVKAPGGVYDLGTRAVVLACGGFAANVEMRVRYLGPRWNVVKVRGMRYNTGDGLKMALEIGAQPYGHWGDAYTTPVDAGAPEYAWPALTDRTRRGQHPYCLLVNIDGRRFADEGADIASFTYARMGRDIQEQPQRLAFQIFDAKTEPLAALPMQREYYATATPIMANSIAELADKLGLERQALVCEVATFNRAVDPVTPFDPTTLDGKGTRGLTPPKSNWALRLDTPPFVAYPVTSGITFTYGGLKINRRAQVLDTSDLVIPGLYAAGELTGGFFYYNYPGGAGLTRGAVTGLRAGRSAVEDG